jgi:dipeptidyl aminopeptidase/acylaminoacyl peptidase
MLIVAFAAFQCAAADPHPFNVRDLVVLRRLSDPQPSPDGQRVAFILRSTDLEANQGRTDLWLVNTGGTGFQQLTVSPENESNPRWSPDGLTLYFLSSRGGSNQVWALPLGGGEARPMTRLPLDVSSFAVSPDGTQLLVSLEVFPDAPTPHATAERLAQQAKSKASGRLYDRLFFRHWDAWNDGRRSHLFVVPVAGGETVDVMRGMEADVPSKPFGGPEEYAFAPDGKSVVFAAKDAGREEAWSTNFDLYEAPVDGSTPPRNLTSSNPAWDTAPVFSPDGRLLVYRAMSRPGYESDRFRIMVREWPEGAEREVASEWDHSASDLVFSADGKSLYGLADAWGHHRLFAIELASGEVRTMVEEGQVDAVRPAGDRIVFARHHYRSPSDLYTMPPQGGDFRRITSVNEEHLARIEWGEPEQFTFKGAGDDTVYAWLVKPVGFDPSRKYPVAFLIHGGPQGSFGNDFHYRWNPQIYAGAGYAAIMVDFHGSTGYGQAFTDSIRGDWGGKPLEDLQKGLAAALERYPFLDGERVAALGASYGGYMVNWIAGMWPEHFRCLVSHAGNLDERLAYFDTEELWFPEWDHLGTPWDNPESYEKHNPIRLVDRWRTPIFVSHGGRDYRVVDTQGMSVFTAAQRRGVPSQFLYFPDENHWILKPHNSIQWHDAVLAWLDRWTN